MVKIGEIRSYGHVATQIGNRFRHDFYPDFVQFGRFMAVVQAQPEDVPLSNQDKWGT